ncbi:MAG: LytR C-terminal domain-containing protein [bacterium]
MDDSEFRPISVQSSTPIKKDKTKLIIAIIVVLLLIGGFFLFQKANSNDQESSVTEERVIIPTEKPSPTLSEEDITPTVEEEQTDETPTPSPLPTTGVVSSRKALNVQVLNGSGTPGVAGEAQTFLKDLGYTVVITGNADNYDYQGATINIKSSRSDYLNDIKNDLGDKYTVNDETGTLESSSEFDVTVIIGS